MLRGREVTNLRAVAVLGTSADVSPTNSRVLPDRFNSNSAPSSLPIVLPELNSISEVKISSPMAESS